MIRYNGYYLLPYHPFNYTVACKPCNTYFKNSYFPIRGARDIEKDDPRNLKSEQAYLESFYNPPSNLHKELAQQAISCLISGKSSHTNCMRSFKRLYETDRDRVSKIVKEIINYLKTVS